MRYCSHVPFDFHLPNPGVELIDELREALMGQVKHLVEEYGEDMTLEEFRRATGVSRTVIRRKFGRWGDLQAERRDDSGRGVEQAGGEMG